MLRPIEVFLAAKNVPIRGVGSGMKKQEFAEIYQHTNSNAAATTILPGVKRQNGNLAAAKKETVKLTRVVGLRQIGATVADYGQLLRAHVLQTIKIVTEISK